MLPPPDSARGGRRLLWCAVAAIALIAAWLVFAQRPAPALPPQATATPAAEVPGGARADTDAAEDAGATDVERQQAEAPGGTLRVRVLRLADRRPVAGAEVLCLPPDYDLLAMSAEDSRDADDDFDGFLRRVGLHQVSDDDGWCELPLHPDHNVIVATQARPHDRLRGRLQVAPGTTGTAEVLIRADHTLRVVVLDFEGAPAPGVAIVAQPKNGPPPDGWTMGPTDASGAVTENHFQERATDASTCPLLLEARAIGAISEPVEIDAAAPPAEVVLTLPPTGTVTVHVRDAAGKPLPTTYLHDDHVALRTAPTALSRSSVGAGQKSAHAQLDANGDATFHHVGLGGYVLAQFGALSSSYVPGPTRDRPHFELLLQEPAGTALCVGIALGPSGAPLADCPLTLRLDDDSRSGSAFAGSQTDELGRFQFRFPQFEPNPGTLTLSHHAVPPKQGASVIWHTTGLVPGENDLGIRQLRPPRLLLGVRFVSNTATVPAMFGVKVEARVGEAWHRRSDLRLQRITEATYELRGTIVDGTTLRLVVPERIARNVAPIEFAPGTEDLVVTLDLGGSVTAVFVTDESMPPDAWYAGLLPAIPDPDSQREVSPYPGALFGERYDNTVTWQALRAGRYRLVVLGMATNAPFVTVDAIEVAAGPCTDPRLTAIDLRGRLRPLEIRVTDPSGAAIRNEAVTVAVRTGSTWSTFPLVGGVATIAAPAGVDLAVFGPHFLTKFVDGVTQSLTVTLSPATTVRASIDCPLPLPAGVTLQLRAVPSSVPADGRLIRGPGNNMALANVLTDGVIVTASGPCEFEVRQPGPHRLSAVVARDRYSYWVAPQGKTTIDLPSDGVLEVRVDADSLRAALQRLNGQR